MRKINLLEIDTNEYLSKFTYDNKQLIKYSNSYDILIQNDEFHQYNSVINDKKNKKELISLYTYQMVRKRNFYNEILATCHVDKCPFCDNKSVNQLDHFLPKSIYPEFSIVQKNLIPICESCNYNKREIKSNEITKMFYNFYRDYDVFNTRHLNIEYYFTDTDFDFNFTIIHEDCSKFKRLVNFYKTLNLFASYKEECWYELKSLKDYICEEDNIAISTYINCKSRAFMNTYNINYFKLVFYEFIQAELNNIKTIYLNENLKR